MIVRPVHVDQHFAELLQRLNRHRAVVDGLLVGTVGLYDAANDQLSAFARFEAERLQRRVDRSWIFQFEQGFGGAGFLAGADDFFVGAFTQQHAEGADENGFARAGFAGDHIESRFEIDGEFFHQREIFYG